MNAVRVGGLADLADVKADVFSLGQEVAAMRRDLGNISRFIVPSTYQPSNIFGDERFFAVLHAGSFVSTVPNYEFTYICLNDCLLHYYGDTSPKSFHVFGLCCERSNQNVFLSGFSGTLESGHALYIGGTVSRLQGYSA